MFFIFLVCTKLLSIEYYFESLHLWKTFLSKECSCFETSTKSFCETVYQVFSDQEQVCQFQLWFIFMHLYCDCCTWLRARLYNGELFSSMSCAMVSVMLLVRIILSTLHSINLWTCLLSSVLAWGQAKSKLGGVYTPNLHHHSIS